MSRAEPVPDALSASRKPPTIYDIAQATGFNPSTVSRALNKPGRINARTEQVIREVATALGYRQNPAARALQTGHTETLAIVLSDITNPVYFELLRGAEQASTAEGYTLLFAESQESPELEAATLNRLQLSVDGIVLVASRMDDDALAKFVSGKPIVLVNRVFESVPSIIPEVSSGLRGALEHLAALGHQSVGYLSGPPASWMNRYRWESLFEHAVSMGLQVVEISSSAPTVDGGHEALRKVRASRVSAVVAYNDLMAMGLMRACREAHMSVPGELSVIGFDDIFGADLFTPSLSTIRSPLGRVGEVAVRSLLASVSGAQPEIDESLTTSFVRRESTGSPRSE